MSVSIDLDSLATSPADRVSALDAEHVRLSTLLTQIHEAIAVLEQPDSLSRSALALLEKYRESEASMAKKRTLIELEIGKLLTEEPEAVQEFDRFHAVDVAEAQDDPVEH